MFLPVFQEAEQDTDQEWQNKLVQTCEAGDLNFVELAVEKYGADRVFNAQKRYVSSVPIRV